MIVKQFIDKDTVEVISRYLENALSRYPENIQGDEGNSCKISFYADPLIEMVLKDKTDYIEQITGLNLYPTFSFVKVYQKGEELKPHVNRPSCEISLSCHIATVGKAWPLWMHTPGNNPTKYILEQGDACIYKGCEIVHWREVATETDINVQIMLHYVNKNGPYAEYKYDCRDKLSVVSCR